MTDDESVFCLACHKDVADGTSSLQCGECNNVYHYGKCSGVTKTKMKAMSADYYQAWKCATCHASEGRQSRDGKDGSTTLTATQTDADTLNLLVRQGAETLERITQMLDRIVSVETQLSTQNTKQEKVKEILEQQNKTIGGVEAAVKFLSEKFDEVSKTLAVQEKTIAELSSQVCNLEGQMKIKDKEIKQIRTALNESELYSRRKNVEVHGVPVTDKENLMGILEEIAEKLEVPTPTVDSVEAVHRLKCKEGKIPAILVRFRDRKVSDTWTAKRNKLRNEGIFVNENLTHYIRQLMWATKTKAHEISYKFAWTRYGKVFVKEKEGKPAIRIKSEEDLMHL